MTSDEFKILEEQLLNEEKSVSETKGKDYTIGDPDRLNNFKTVGKLVGCPHCFKPIGPRAVWAVYFLKHVLAVLSWAKTGKLESEGLFGRFLDLRVYSTLGLGISREKKND